MRRMSTSTPIRVGLLGFGIGGAVFHAPLIAATSGLVLDAIVTANPERQAQARKQHPSATVVCSADELWQRKIDLAVITTPNRTHVPLAHAAIDRGLDVVVDKPLAPTAAEGRELAARGAAAEFVKTLAQRVDERLNVRVFRGGHGRGAGGQHPLARVIEHALAIGAHVALRRTPRAAHDEDFSSVTL